MNSHQVNQSVVAAPTPKIHPAPKIQPTPKIQPHGGGSGMFSSLGTLAALSSSLGTLAALSSCLGILAALMFLPPTEGYATDRYPMIPMNRAFEDPANLRRMVTAAKTYASAESVDDFADVGYARAYYLLYLPALITQPDGTNDTSALMTTIRKRISRANRGGKPGAANIIKWVFTGMKKVAQGDYRPSSRMTAISMISRIDVKSEDRIARRPPEPYSAIPTVLLPIYQDTKNSDGVRAAALKGLQRYTNLTAALQTPLPAPLRDALIREMQRLITQPPPIQRDEAAHAYMQRFAIDILTALQLATDQSRGNQLGAQLVSISTDQTSHQLLALHAASRLGNVNDHLVAGGGSANKILASWSKLVSKAMDSEVNRLEALTRPRIAAHQPVAPDALAKINVQPANKNNPRQLHRRGHRQAMMGDDPMDDQGEMNQGMDNDEMNAGEMNAGEMGTGEMGRGMPGIRSSHQPPEVVMSRRKLIFVLQQLHHGAVGTRKRRLPDQTRGLMAAVSADDQVIVRQWVVQVHQLIDAINHDSTIQRDQYIDLLKKQTDHWQQLSIGLAKRS